MVPFYTQRKDRKISPGGAGGKSPLAAGNSVQRESELSPADLKNTTNNGETKGAPQQTVVNGWYANDIAAVTAARREFRQERESLMLLGIGVAGELIIRGAERARINCRATA